MTVVMDAPSTSRALNVTEDEENESDALVKFHYMTLLDEVEGITENSNVLQNVSRINDVLDKANKIFPQVKKPSQLYLDAKVIHSSATSLEDTAINLDVGEGNFKLFTFAEQLRTKTMNNENQQSWEVLASVAQPVIHNSLPHWSPLLGSFDNQAELSLIQSKEKRPRAQKEKDQIVEKKEPEKLKSVDKTHEGIAVTIQNIYAKLKTYYKQNGKRPINYFRFVINPNSFSATVENIFHVSFLINDGAVKLELDDNNDEPVIFPTSKGKENANPETDRQSHERLQNIFSIDMKTWKEMAYVLKINSPMI